MKELIAIPTGLLRSLTTSLIVAAVASTVTLDAQTKLDAEQLKRDFFSESAWCAAPSMQADGATLTIGPRWGLGDRACRLRADGTFYTFFTPIPVTISSGNLFGGHARFWIGMGISRVTIGIQASDEVFDRLELPEGVDKVRVTEGVSWVLVGEAYIMGAEWTDVYQVLGSHQVVTSYPDKVEVFADRSDLVITTRGEIIDALEQKIAALEARVAELESQQ